jgi:hypothetical protein
MVRIKFYWDIIDESFHIFSIVSWVRTKVAVDKGEMVWLSGVRGKASWEDVLRDTLRKWFEMML